MAAPNSSRATVRSSRFGVEGGWSGFGPNPYDEERARAGAQTLYHQEAERRQDERQALEEQRFQEREARLQAHEAKLEDIRHAEFMRKEAEQAAIADRKLAFEKEAAEVLPHLLRINPTDKDAQEKFATMMEAHPSLLISGFAKESVLPLIQSHMKEIQAAQKASGVDAAKTQKQTDEDARIAAEVAKGGLVTSRHIGGATIKPAAELAAEQAAAEKKASMPNEATKKQHAVASEKLENAQTQLEDTQTQIAAREKELAERPKSKDGPYDPATLKAKQKELEELKSSAVNWNLEMEKHNAVKSALESIHPDLSSTYQPPAKDTVPPALPVVTPSPETETAPVEPTGKDVTAVPANPNLVPSTTPALASTGDDTKPAAVAPPPPVTPGVVPPVVPPTGQPATPDHQAAIDWANANPDDPRAKKIKQLHGIQ